MGSEMCIRDRGVSVVVLVHVTLATGITIHIIEGTGYPWHVNGSTITKLLDLALLYVL